VGGEERAQSWFGGGDLGLEVLGSALSRSRGHREESDPSHYQASDCAALPATITAREDLPEAAIRVRLRRSVEIPTPFIRLFTNTHSSGCAGTTARVWPKLSP
jgi:hypothetical protein